jgi:hypothetical protein
MQITIKKRAYGPFFYELIYAPVVGNGAPVARTLTGI